MSVAYAGSLQLVNEDLVGPAFSRATGLLYQGRGGGSFGIAREIVGGVIHPDVFLSLGAAPWRLLGAKSPYAVGFATSPLCLVYNPHSRFARELNAIARGAEPLSRLWPLLARPGFQLGRTNPLTDPQGQMFVLAVRAGVAAAHLPVRLAARILGPLTTSPEIFAEEAILSRLQGGELDAASAFVPEAIQRHLPYIRLPASLNFGDPNEATTYAHDQVTLPNGQRITGALMLVLIAPVGPSTAGTRFIAFTLSRRGLALYRQAGFSLITPRVFGRLRAVPPAIRHDLSG